MRHPRRLLLALALAVLAPAFGGCATSARDRYERTHPVRRDEPEPSPFCGIFALLGGFAAAKYGDNSDRYANPMDWRASGDSVIPPGYCVR